MVGEAVIKVAQSLLYIRERTGQNDHPMIDKMLGYLGLPHGLSWCLAFCLWCFHTAVNPMPYPKTARCSTFWAQTSSDEWRYKTFDAEDVAWQIEKVQTGDIMIFSSSKVAGKKNWNGHAALVERPDTLRIWRTIEGNTNGAGSREGNGVYRKVRAAKQGSLSLEGFVRSRRI